MGRGDPSVRSFAENILPHERHWAAHRASVSAFDIPPYTTEEGMMVAPMLLWRDVSRW